jgi:hypothetical protein
MEWITSGRDANSYLPFYTFQTPSKVTDIWTEYTSGLNGFLPVRDLEDTWGARWSRNNSGLKTEMGRRKKVIQLVEALVKKPNWNVPLAIRFLEAKYDNPSHPPRKFCEYLQKTPAPGELSGINAVLIVANAFT